MGNYKDRLRNIVRSKDEVYNEKRSKENLIAMEKRNAEKKELDDCINNCVNMIKIHAEMKAHYGIYNNDGSTGDGVEVSGFYSPNFNALYEEELYRVLKENNVEIGKYHIPSGLEKKFFIKTSDRRHEGYFVNGLVERVTFRITDIGKDFINSVEEKLGSDFDICFAICYVESSIYNIKGEYRRKLHHAFEDHIRFKGKKNYTIAGELAFFYSIRF